MKNGLIVGIDASRNRSGGAKAHMIGIISGGNPENYGISIVHVWAFKSLLNSLPDRSWLIKHNPSELDQSLVKQLWWQARKLSHEAISSGCDIVFTTDASTLCRFKPMVVLSQDALSYEPGVMKLFGYSIARLRLLAILFLQNRAMRFADGVMFLTRYAGEIIQKSTGKLKNVAYVPHGVDDIFRDRNLKNQWLHPGDRPLECVYISNTAMYKHQWVVVEAIALLRRVGIDIRLQLVGGGRGRAQKLLESTMRSLDPGGVFVKQMEFIPQNQLPFIFENADIFIFASSCETISVTLLEAMATGLPIACSDRGPMPEVLEDGGIYFNPENAESIACAVKEIIMDSELRLRIASRAKELSDQYSWSRCADETFKFIVSTYRSLEK